MFKMHYKLTKKQKNRNVNEYIGCALETLIGPKGHLDHLALTQKFS